MNYFLDTEFLEGFYKPLFGKRRHFIDLISIGIVADDGREYYAVNRDMDLKKAWEDDWIRKNVLESLHDDLYRNESMYAKTYHYESIAFTYKGMKNLIKWHGKSIFHIRHDIEAFVNPQRQLYSGPANWFSEENVRKHNYSIDMVACQPTFYAYYADYDWVLFCSMFGRMINLPEGFPMYCRDLKQMMDERGLDKDLKQMNCPEPKNAHNALEDARWNKQLFDTITNKK